MPTRSPHFIYAQEAGTCAETGRNIKKGERIAYYPATGLAYADDSKQAESLRAQHLLSNPSDRVDAMASLWAARHTTGRAKNLR